MSKEMVDAIYDLARVIIAVNGKFDTKAEAVRRLHEFQIPPTRIAAILAMEPKAVYTVISRLKQKTKADKVGLTNSDGANANGEE